MTRVEPEHYRADIDGLRAIAVLAVVGFHAFPSWVPGGFVGVDVFFVVSGFLISQQLFAACDSGTFSLTGFYVRRVRRIVPALLLVVLATATFGWFALSPEEYSALQQHLAASAFFSNNILLWQQAGYFDAPSSTKPLLHLWSLGIEEQFYLVWPWLIWWCWRKGFNRTVVIGVLAAVSFLLNTTLVADGSSAAAFFLPHTRLWQLGAGAWLAAVIARLGEPIGAPISRTLFLSPTPRDSRWTNSAMSTIGVLMIAIAIVAISRTSQPSWWTEGPVTSLDTFIRFIGRTCGLAIAEGAYPGWPALFPTLGTVLVIAGGREAFFNRTILSVAALVTIGLISYPLYLWHWPMLSFLQITEQGDVPRNAVLLALAASFVLAGLTYMFVELPLRTWISVATPGRAFWLAGALGMIGAIAVAGLVTGTLTPPGRSAVAGDSKVPGGLNEPQCRSTFHLVGGYCQQYLSSSAPVTTALLGDSHASQFFPGLGARLAEQGENLVQLGQTSCPPLLDLERIGVIGDATCTRVNRASIEALAAFPAIQHVILTFRGALINDGFGFRDDETERTAFRYRLLTTGATGLVAVRASLQQTTAWLIAHQKRVTIVLPTPELHFRVDECTGRPLSLSHGPARVPCGISRASVLEQQVEYRALVEDIARNQPIEVIDPLDVLCDPTWCPVVVDGQMLYTDDNHLGIIGSSFVARAFPLR